MRKENYPQYKGRQQNESQDKGRNQCKRFGISQWMEHFSLLSLHSKHRNKADDGSKHCRTDSQFGNNTLTITSDMMPAAADLAPSAIASPPAHQGKALTATPETLVDVTEISSTRGCSPAPTTVQSRCTRCDSTPTPRRCSRGWAAAGNRSRSSKPGWPRRWNCSRRRRCRRWPPQAQGTCRPQR